MIDPIEEEEPRPRSRISPVRFLLHQLIKLFVLIFLSIRYVLRPRAAKFALVGIVIVGGAAWWLLANNAAQPVPTARSVLNSSAAPLAAPASSQIPQSPVVQEYLRAQAAFDAQGMWNTFGDQLKQAMQSSNTTVADLQAQLDAARQQGRKYVSATYVGGMLMSGGRVVYFYVLSVDTGNGLTDVPYIYEVGPDGKIASIQ